MQETKRSAVVIWLTGLSGAGKTTIATALLTRLQEQKILCELLDGDEIRPILGKGLGFSKADRGENIRRMTFVAGLLARNNIVVVVAAITPYEEFRKYVRNALENYVEVFIACSLEECERRDSKGLYKKVRTGEIVQFTGIDDPFEEPLNAEIICNTEQEDVNQCVDKIVKYLVQHQHLFQIKRL